ncbi:uncharacterized protein PV07_04592 [Cladophialophora immunda]|uniref:Uncharacterized protein n=1 Tax=Cladophialophora immunda TaxID=569365 RepID=A0A0D2B6A6_9EURO|nr:uncharacterized protein PV07_04592 [Cladophialophora immunda]KIW33097.1 hypothetical protein PV07_04592 [Cladophialophora immunda]
MWRVTLGGAHHCPRLLLSPAGDDDFTSGGMGRIKKAWLLAKFSGQTQPDQEFVAESRPYHPGSTRYGVRTDGSPPQQGMAHATNPSTVFNIVVRAWLFCFLSKTI